LASRHQHRSLVLLHHSLYAPISPSLIVAYVHGFGLLAYKKLWPKLQPQVQDYADNLRDHGYLTSLTLLIVVKDVAEGDDKNPLKNAEDAIKEKADNIKESLGVDGA
jgi:hypothetical protein